MGDVGIRAVWDTLITYKNWIGYWYCWFYWWFRKCLARWRLLDRRQACWWRCSSSISLRNKKQKRSHLRRDLHSTHSNVSRWHTWAMVPTLQRLSTNRWYQVDYHLACWQRRARGNAGRSKWTATDTIIHRQFSHKSNWYSELVGGLDFALGT